MRLRKSLDGKKTGLLYRALSATEMFVHLRCYMRRCWVRGTQDLECLQSLSLTGHLFQMLSDWATGAPGSISTPYCPVPGTH